MRRVTAFVLALSAFAALTYAQPLQVDIDTDPPKVVAQGKVELRSVNLQELGERLAYPGVGADNFFFRLSQAAACRGMNADGTVTRAQELASVDVSGVREYREIVSSRIVVNETHPLAANQFTCDNTTGEEPLTCATSLTKTVTNTVTRSSTWSVSATFTQEVNYRIGSSASPAGAGGSTSLSFTGGYGQSTGSSEAVTLGATNSATVTVPAGRRRELTLFVDQGSMTVEVDYHLDIEGPVIAVCPGGGKTYRTTIADLYDGVPPLPGNQWPWATGAAPTHRLELTESIHVDRYSNARVE